MRSLIKSNDIRNIYGESYDETTQNILECGDRVSKDSVIWASEVLYVLSKQNRLDATDLAFKGSAEAIVRAIQMGTIVI